MKKKTIVVVWLCVLMAMVGLSNISNAETAFIQLNFRPASEVMPFVQDMLSPEGKASFDQRTNTVVIMDSQESIDHIRGFLERLDQPGKQARVRVRFHEAGSSSRRSALVEGSISGSNWRVSKGRTKRDGVDVYLEDRNRSRSGQSEYFINVMSGSWAYILVGKEIVYEEYWGDLCRRYGGGCAQGFFLRRIESGVEVRPTIIGNRADIEVIPRISGPDPKGRDDVIRFAGASTRISAPLGEWVTIGGSSSKSNEVMRALLERGRGQGQSVLSISLMVQGID
ncbi:MAG: hypothetical protein JRJ82_13745 [Deltaproteobacteria bacterium]|nr:hypothetical protein [Deltaproteobacteria bacterium]